MTTIVRTPGHTPLSQTPRRKSRPHVDVARIARTISSHHDLWNRLVEFDPATRYYARVAAGIDYEAWLLTWLPGQGTDWHDHSDSAGSFVVLRGHLDEQVATWNAPSLRHAPTALARPAGVITDLGPDEQRTFGRRHLHQVANTGAEPAVSLHVYAPRLTTMTTYALSDGALSRIETRREGESW